MRKPEIERPGLNGSLVVSGAVENLQPVAERVVEHDQVPDAALLGERARAARDLDAGLFEARGHGVERGGVRDFPAEEADALAAVLADDDALLAVVHAQREALGALVDELHPEEAGAEVRPVLQRLGADADVSETFDRHGPPPLCLNVIARNMSFRATLAIAGRGRPASGICGRATRRRPAPGSRGRRSGSRSPPARRPSCAGCRRAPAPSRSRRARRSACRR